MNNVVRVCVAKMWETCERTTFYVNLISDEGFTMTAAGHATGSIYTEGKGLSIEEARDRALIDAGRWADFLGLEVDPLVEDGVTYEPSMKMLPYTTQRVLAERRAAKNS